MEYSAEHIVPSSNIMWALYTLEMELKIMLSASERLD